jgi:hypothetical protein
MVSTLMTSSKSVALKREFIELQQLSKLWKRLVTEHGEYALTLFGDSNEHIFRLRKTGHLSIECITGHVPIGFAVFQRNRLVAEIVVDLNGGRAKRPNLCSNHRVLDDLEL